MSEILRHYRVMAATGLYFRGLTVLRHEAEIGELIRKHSAVTILDYGAGAGEAYEPPFELHNRWGVPRPTLYDPAFRYNSLPRVSHHGVICSDVLEHVPPVAVRKVVMRLFGYADRFLFASVCCRPAGKTFPDGVTNLHITIRPFEWWRDLFQELSPKDRTVDWHLMETP